MAQCVATNCGICCRCSSDPMLLWLSSKFEAAALIRTLAWELPYTMDAALKRKKKIEKDFWGVPIVAQYVKKLTSIHEDIDSIPGFT